MSEVFPFQINHKAPDFKYTKIKFYEEFIRQELVDPVFAKFRRDIETNNMHIDLKMMQRFRFDKEDGRQFLISSLDILGDSESAISEFKKLRDTDHARVNYAEMYLRIYGVLAAVYIHSQAIDTLSELFKVEEVKYILKKIDESEIMYMRHIISAHPLNFSTDRKTTESFQLVRISVSQPCSLQIRNHQGVFKDHNLFNYLDEYEKLAENALQQLATKMIRLLYCTNVDRIPELIDKLDKIKR
ncbi:hypothetical protein Dfri01_55750 [Dyadobacter frigoris]|uniref:hypothetical protein n=1 Tax=Dyadobacter frigoris TaxID=2576211 RepID=UPI00249FBA87|nr:hypothetical protein [Dyadobacter frigoris]GLU56114.1 hypothetical protein Dfri01_55750 [Dyadobacter frigoris]